MPISSLALYLSKEGTRLVLAHPYPEGRDVGTGLNLISPQPKPSLGLPSATQPPNGSSTVQSPQDQSSREWIHFPHDHREARARN